MKILGIESSCDETAASVLLGARKVLSSVISSQIDVHKAYGGVVPEIASRMHAENIVHVTRKALFDANSDLSEIDAIAVTYGPGLVGSLLVGIGFAKGLSLATGIPIVPIHHLRAHIAANFIAHENLEPPFLSLVVSGGHTHIIEVLSYQDFKVVGQTRDDAAGETFDKAARALGLSYPGGVNLDKLAASGDKNKFSFPRPKVETSPFDFSFSGLKTSIINKIKNEKKYKIEDLAASFCYSIADYLTTKLMLASLELNHKKVVIAGGVCANSFLREMLKEECTKHGFELFMPPANLCCDNAAMVACSGYYEFLKSNTAKLDLNAYASLPIEKSYGEN